MYVLSKSQGGGPDFDNTYTMAYGTDPDPYGAIPPYQVRRGRWSDARRQPTSRDAGIPGINNTVATGAVDGCLAREPTRKAAGG